MKYQNITHTIGLVACLIGAIFVSCNPNKDITDIMWPLTALCWCASSWIATARAEQN
jgi:hypothetical protein